MGDRMLLFFGLT